MDRHIAWVAMCLALGMYPHVASGKELTYALVVLPKAGVNMPLVESVQQGLTRVASHFPGLLVRLPDEVNRLLNDDAKHALVECHGDFGCIGGLATRAHADALMLARVSPSTVAEGGVVMQFLILAKGGRGVERKCAVELADAADVDLVLRASFLSLFGMTLRGTQAKGPVLALTFDKPKKGAVMAPDLEAVNDRVEDLELTLATLDATQGVNADNLAVLDGLITATQALLAQLTGVIEQMDATATPRWLRPRPPVAAEAP